MEIMYIIVLFLIILFIMGPVSSRENKLDLVSKEESNLSEEGTHTPEHIEITKEVINKPSKPRKRIKKIILEESTCELENVEIAAPAVEKKKKSK